MVTLEVYLLLLMMLIADASFESATNESHGNLHGRPGQGYYIEVDIGTPPQRLNVLVDTGSSNLAISCIANPLIQKYFHRNESTTYTSDGTHVSVSYTEGHWEGFLGSDTVAIPSAGDLAAIRVDFSCITKSERFFISGSNWSGILGLAYRDLARPSPAVTPFFDRLVEVESINNVFSLQLSNPLDGSDSTDGTLTFGGIDSMLFMGNISYAPLRREWYYDIVLADLIVGDVPLLIDCKELNTDRTVVDSGTTNLRLPKKVFEVVVAMLKQHANLYVTKIPDDFWNGGSFMCWDDGLPNDVFPRLGISVAVSQNDTFVLSVPPQNYLLETHRVGSLVSCYTFAISSSDTGTVLGTVIMGGFYVIFDRENKRVGFAQLSGSGNHVDPAFISRPSPSGTKPCSLKSPASSDNGMPAYVTYLISAVCGLCLIPLLIIIIKCAFVVKKSLHYGNTNKAASDHSLCIETMVTESSIADRQTLHFVPQNYQHMLSYFRTDDHYLHA